MDQFDVECNKCGVAMAVSVPIARRIRSFTCPGCGGVLVVDTSDHIAPYPQHDITLTPVAQAAPHLFTN